MREGPQRQSLRSALRAVPERRKPARLIDLPPCAARHDLKPHWERTPNRFATQFNGDRLNAKQYAPRPPIVRDQRQHRSRSAGVALLAPRGTRNRVTCCAGGRFDRRRARGTDLGNGRRAATDTNRTTRCRWNRPRHEPDGGSGGYSWPAASSLREHSQHSGHVNVTGCCA